MSLSHRNQSIDLLCKLIDWFLYEKDIDHERVKKLLLAAKLITSTFIQGQNDMKRTWKKIMQITNVNKKFTTFPTMIKFLRTLMNS